MEAVDSLDVGRLGPPGGPIHRVGRHGAVDPAGAVTSEQLVGQRRQHKVLRRERPSGQALGLKRKFGAGNAADETGCQQAGRHFVQPAPHLVDHVEADHAGLHPTIEKPVAGLAEAHRLGKQFAERMHHHATLAQGVDEYVVFLARPLHP